MHLWISTFQKHILCHWLSLTTIYRMSEKWSLNDEKNGYYSVPCIIYHNFEINIMSFVLQSIWSPWHPDNRQQNYLTEWDCFKTKVRFSDAFFMSHRIIQSIIRQYDIRHSLQNIFKFIFMLNWSKFCTYVKKLKRGFAVGTERHLERPKSIRPIKHVISRQQRTSHQAANQSASKVQNRQHQKTKTNPSPFYNSVPPGTINK